MYHVLGIKSRQLYELVQDLLLFGLYGFPVSLTRSIDEFPPCFHAGQRPLTGDKTGEGSLYSNSPKTTLAGNSSRDPLAINPLSFENSNYDSR